MSSSKQCPIFIKEKAIVKLKSEKNISYQEAKRQLAVSGSSQPTGQNSYASVAKRAFTNSETQTIMTWQVDAVNFSKLPTETSYKIMKPSKKVLELINKVKG